MPTTLPETTNPPLSIMMRDGSVIEHREAESSSFMSTMLDGRINAAGYTAYLRSLRPVYEALETVGESLADHAVVGSMVDSRLERLPALDRDIAYWEDRSALAAASGSSAAVQAYVDRLHETAEEPALYVAHHYTRYLGDLSGGQAIGRILSRTYDIARGGEGLEFYEFPAIEKPKPYKDGYRGRLDALALTAEEQEHVVVEVRRAFALNGALFDELTEQLDAFTD